MSQAKDIIDEISHRLPSRTNIYPALNRAIRMVAKRLKFHDSRLVKGSLSISVSADSAAGTLPSDFWGLMGKPYVSGLTYELLPLPNQRTKLLYTSNSTPKYYELLSTTIDLTPGTSSAITIIGDYWQKPTAITKPTDTMPYAELFDDAIQEALLHVYVTGGSSVDGNYINMMENFIYKAIDEIMPGLEQKTPKKIPQGVNFNSFMWGR